MSNLGATHTVDMIVTTLFNRKSNEDYPRYVLGYLVRNLATGNSKLVAREEAFMMGFKRAEAHSQGLVDSPLFFDNASIHTFQFRGDYEYFLLTEENDYFRDETMIADFTARNRTLHYDREYSSAEAMEVAAFMADRVIAGEFDSTDRMKDIIYHYRNILYPRAYINGANSFSNIRDLSDRIRGEDDKERKQRRAMYGRDYR
ncbi:hypothetical protein ABGV42_00985 [Paenibacillus pabuli]|uniref:hypothetical protein n=1 Tax=Paenibacillus pabuli TaxID=1472 RepID=UPI003242302C